ncbi:MAG: transglycosylase domain-containing protein, partial [Chloroflexi bacterium]|nr:transglycosylase domain-containing protein [Chloroflexota bacterium]
AQSYLANDLPSVQDLGAYRAPSTLMIYDRNNKLLAELNDLRYGRHISIPLSDVSPLLVKATIATEDPTFETNSGISIQGIVRALVNNVSGGEDTAIQGGSSITQQLVKNVLIPEEERTQRTLSRKVREVLLSFELTRAYPKEKLLEVYLNDIYYGNLSYGVEAAAQNYFDKPAKALDLAESALLAGLPQAPGNYNPLQSPELAKQRQRQVLDMMVRANSITEAEADAAFAEPLRFRRDQVPFEAPHFVMYVRNLLAERLGERGLYKQSLKVTTSLDLDMQHKAEELVKQHIARVGPGLGAGDMAMVALDPAVGEVRVMVGSVDYNNDKISGQVNMATSPRMPGSSIKPYVYLTAFLRGWNPATIVLDAPLSMRDGLGRGWNPRNATGTNYGPMPARNALANSLNLPAIRTIIFAGVENVINTLHKMGITSLDRGAQFYGPPLALGTGEISLLDHVYGFSVFDNLGIMRGEPRRPDQIQP